MSNGTYNPGTNGHANGNGKAPSAALDGFRLPPQNIEAEKNVIAAAIYNQGVLPDLVATLRTPDAFFRENHQAIWAIILERYAAGETIDPVHIFEALEHAGRHDLADPLNSAGLGSILETNPIVYDPVGSAIIVRDKAMLRGTMETANEIIRDGYSNLSSAEDVLARAMDRLNGVAVEHEVSSTVTVAELIPEVRARIVSRQNGNPSGLLSGFAEIDGVTDGFQAQELVVLAARPSMGKTALALNICDFVSTDRKLPSLFVSLEMSARSLAERLLVSRSGVDGHKIKTGEELARQEWARIDKAQGDFARGAQVHIVERPARNYVQIAAEIRASHARNKIALAVVDYAQLIDSENGRDTETQAVTKVSKAMKAVARELNIVVILLSQLNRAVEGRDDHVPRMSDLRSSGSLEQDADIVLLLHRPDYYAPADRPNEADCNIAKNRNGRVGTFNLWFRKGFMKFEDYCCAPSIQEFDHVTNGAAAY